MRSLVRLVGFMVGVLVCSGSQAQALELDFSKAKFKPMLLESKSPVCNQILSEAQTVFFTKSTTIPSYFLTHSPLRKTEAGASIYNAQPVSISNKPINLSLITHRGCGGACEAYQLLPQAVTPTSESSNFYAEEMEQSVLNKLPPAVRDSDAAIYPAENGSIYLYTFTDTFQVHALTANATWELQCKISIKPEATSNQEMSNVLNSLNAISNNAEKITGNYGSCGSMATGHRLLRRMDRALQKLSYRPWELYKEVPTGHQQFWSQWAQQGPYEKYAYDDFKIQFKNTQETLAKFYVSTFGWTKPQADTLAHNSLTEALGQGFILNDLTERSYQEKPLSGAIELPEVVASLLERGEHPDDQNAFNKTPLMYAAQYNQLESAKLLLGKGANPNLFTIIPEDNCGFTLSKSGMTALHYAVRYAGIDLIKLLLNNGANAFASTSEAEGGRPIDWLHKYTETSASERNSNLTQENIAELEKLLNLPGKEDVARKVLNFNLAAEKSFQKGNFQDAYQNSLFALGLDEVNERTLANLSLILMKQDKLNEALEASNKLIFRGTDKNQIANAWFNYGLICGKDNSNYISYNGNVYCREGALHSFIESFKAKPTTGRAEKVITLIKTAKSACEFSPEQKGLIRLVKNCGEGSSDFCILHSPQKTINPGDFSVLKQTHEIPNDYNSPLKITAVKPAKIVESFPLGNYQLTMLSRDYGDDPVQFGDRICTSSSELLPAPKYP